MVWVWCYLNDIRIVMYQFYLYIYPILYISEMIQTNVFEFDSFRSSLTHFSLLKNLGLILFTYLLIYLLSMIDYYYYLL